LASALKSDERIRSNRGGGADGAAAFDSPARPRSQLRRRRRAQRPSAKSFDPRKIRQQLDFRLLRDNRIRRLVLAQLTSAAGDGFVLVALPFAISAAGGSDSQFSLALAIQALTMAFLFLPSGVIGDRFNRRRALVLSDLMRFSARGAFAILLILGDATFWQLLVAQGINGAGTALFNTTMDGFVPEVFTGEKRIRRINALRILAFSLGLTVGPAVGALIYSAGGAASTFALDAFTFLGSAALIYRLPTPFANATSEPVTLRALAGDLKEGWTAFWKIPWYWRVAAEFAVVNTLVFAPYFVIGPHVAEESLGGPPAWAAILVGLGAGEVLGAIVVMAWEPKRPLLFATAVISVWVAPLLLLAALAPVVVLSASAVLAGMAFAMFGAIWDTAKQTHPPSHLRARLSSFDHFGSLGLVPLGYVLGGVMLSLVGATAALIAGALIVGAATFAVITDPSIRDLTPSESETPTKTRPSPEVALAGGGAE